MVAPGDGVVWTYRDNACDLAACAGHDIRIEDGTPGGRSLGFMRHAAGEQQIRWKIPADAQPESIIRYLCLAHADLGMTGAFQILPIGLGTITYPTLPGH